MTLFKVVSLPSSEVLANKKDMYTVKVANLALEPIANAIQAEAMGGWILHSCTVIPATIWRKKGLLEKIFGWIPIIGILFTPKEPEMINPYYYSLVFYKEEDGTVIATDKSTSKEKNNPTNIQKEENKDSSKDETHSTVYIKYGEETKEDTNPNYWTCKCGTKNLLSFKTCMKCDKPKSE